MKSVGRVAAMVAQQHRARETADPQLLGRVSSNDGKVETLFARNLGKSGIATGVSLFFPGADRRLNPRKSRRVP